MKHHRVSMIVCHAAVAACCLCLIHLTAAGSAAGSSTSAGPQSGITSRGKPAATPAQSGRPAQPPGTDADWWSKAQKEIAAHEYQVSRVAKAPAGVADVKDGTYQAPNRAHDLRTYFTDRGPRVTRRTDTQPSWVWGLELQDAPAVEKTSASGNRFEYHRKGGLVEWYVNGTSGLEQGFTVVSASDSEIVMDLAVRGDLLPGMMPDGRTLEFLSSDGVAVIHYGGLKATDARGRELPCRIELANASRLSDPSFPSDPTDPSDVDADGPTVRLIVDAAGAHFPVTIDPLATSAAWTAESNQATAFFGCSVASAGDVNGDGYSDVIVGAYLYDNGESDEGAAFLYLGSATGLASSPAWTAEGNQEAAEFGKSVALAGDVDGDGYSDVIVGARKYDNEQTNEGRAYVYLGSATGLSTSPAWTAESNQASAYFAESTASAGDVNGDGYSDVIVGAYSYDNGQTDEGCAFVYLGSASGLASSPAWTAESNQASAWFGMSVASAGDVNGDGYSDVIVGASKYDNGQTDEGRASVYLGSPSGLASSAAWTAESNQASADFGVSVASAGDVNGDGYSDVIVGAYSYDNGQTDEGRASVYLGSPSGLASSAAWTTESNQASALYGASVASAGDVNGDGYSDVIVAASMHDNGQTDEGSTFVYFGSASGLASSPAWTAESNQASAWFGMCVASAGDVNGDGYSDVIVGASKYDNGETDEGRAFVYLGSPSGPAASAGWTAESDQASALYGASVASAGDVNGDGYPDAIVGVQNYSYGGDIGEGRTYVYLGSASGLSSTPAWTAESDQAGAGFGNSVASAGDVNGDGYSDVIVGAWCYDNGQNDEGSAFVYLGSATGLAPSPAWTAESDQAAAWFGYRVASAGDVNGDGYSDVIVGACDYDNGEDNEGRAYVYLGSALGLSSSPAWTAESNQASAYFGASVASAGDVNGDGYSDVIVGADGYDNGQTDEGHSFVYLGSASGPSASAAWTAESNQASAAFGRSVASAGDVNGDGYSDVIVGADRCDNGEADEGRAFVYLGSATGLGSSVAWTAESNQSSAWFGCSVASAGDVNGDGYSDVIVGAIRYDNGETDEGRAFVYLGSLSGLAASATWTGESNQASANFGYRVAAAGDVNGDGYSDVIVGTPYYDNGETDEGRAFVYYGNGEAGRGLSLNPRQRNKFNTGPVASGGATTTTAMNIAARARTPYGRARVKLQWELKPAGIPFDGTGLFQGAAWSDTGTTGVELCGLNEELLRGERYQWRARFLYDPAFGFPQLHSRWLATPGLGATEMDFRVALPPVSVWHDDTFNTDVTNPAPGGTIGWTPFSSYQTGQVTDYDSGNQALRVTIATGTVPRINGWTTANSEWLPYTSVGTANYVRGKFYVFRTGQADPANLNEIPNMRLRLATRFAVNSILEIFNHLAGDSAGTNAGRDIRPSEDPTSPSVYRVDFDPVDVAALGTAGEGISRGFEAYSLESQENGSIELTESVIGTYGALLLPDSGTAVRAERLLSVSASDAGDLKVFNTATDGPTFRKFALVLPGVLGSEVALDGSTDPTYLEDAAGVTFDTTAVATNRVGLAVREFTEMGANTARVRVEPGRQYKVRWHVTSTANANRNPQLRLRGKSLKFMWSQKLEIGGALAAGSLNNAIAQQALPGVGTGNPDQMTPGENGGWYTMFLHTPMSAEIRDSQPYLNAQPGPGSASTSIRDIKFGFDVIDTLSGMTSSVQEKGAFTLDRIELRAYYLIPD